ncbi:MAG: alpha-2-macroglobulin family protein, partial [Planctomycetota bacterium]
YVEAVTVYDGDVYTQVREIVVPPEDRVLNVEVTPDKKEYKPGEKAKVKVTLTEAGGEPFDGSLVMTMYDKSVEYISGGSNVPDIKTFHWKWRRHHNVSQQHTLNRTGGNHNIGQGMQYIGVFGRMIPQPTDGERQLAQTEDEVADAAPEAASLGFAGKQGGRGGGPRADSDRLRRKSADKAGGAPEEPGADMAETTVRTTFADTAFWSGTLETDKNGQAEVEITMPENLTTWKTTVWAMGAGARCGQGTAEAVTTKNLIVRLQAPRFFVQKDEVVLSANIHNYLDAAKTVTAVLELEGPCLVPVGGKAAGEDGVIRLTRKLQVDAKGEKRVDWRVKVAQPGTAVIRMKGLTDQESDAMQMTFPVLVHGILKTESWTGVVLPEVMKNTVVVRVPAERRPEQTELTVRFSPSLAMAMVDALPYLVEYPHGCTEQTLNRFVPTVITQKILREMELDLDAIKKKRANLNAQELGDPEKRAAQWKRFERNPVFDREEVTRMVKAGLDKLTNMQNADGGWGWFSGWGEHSYPHTTAVVVHGLQVARANDVAIVPGVLERGIAWLETYQARQIQLLKNAEQDPKVKPWKSHTDNLDALVYTVLVDEKKDSDEMRRYLYRDRTTLSVYAKAMFGLALHKAGHHEQRDMLKRNVEQYLQQDDENQTAWLKLPNAGWWWYWYGSEIEAHAWYLKLLAATEPKSEKASRLVKYLVNNRKHATYWNNTRDTAYAIEALADYIRATGQDKPEMTVTVLVDGKEHAKVEVTPDNLFTIDNTVVLKGTDVTDGKHTIEIRRTGKGRLYWNAYLTNFTMEDPITHAGLEIKVRRKFYKLVEVDKTVKAEGAHGQAVDKKVEKYERKPLENLDELKSGDLLEVELVIESKNDYEYILFEDLKAAGTEPVQVRSGYNGNDMGAYVEFRDQRVVFFVRQLARGKHSVSYRLRAEIPGRFSALPTKASAMYAPELKANSDEFKLKIVD